MVMAAKCTYNSKKMILRWILVVCCIFSGRVHCYVENVQLDLDSGVVRGYSRLVHFLYAPSAGTAVECSKSAVLRLNFEPSFQAVKISLRYSKPKLWTLHIADGFRVEGYGQGEPSANIELQVVNRQLRVYGHSGDQEQGPHQESFIITDSPRVMQKALDGTVKVDSEAELYISAGPTPSFTWHDGRFLQSLPAPFEPFRTLYLGLNRALDGPWSPGSGLCEVNVTMMEKEDQCLEDGGPKCSPHAICKPTRKSHRCVCKTGWEGDGKTCSDVDECRIKNGGCAHICVNTPGSYYCECYQGFKSDPEDPHNCVDMDECRAKGAHTCKDQRCINTVGSYHCSCNSPLLTLDTSEVRCKPAPSACVGFGCSHICELSPRGSASCRCRRHHILNPDLRSCTPTCSAGNGGCQHRCLDTEYGPTCTCANKYMLGTNRKSCLASCLINNGGCEKFCANTDVGTVCSCPTGFVLNKDGKTCRDINECADPKKSPCEFKCINSQGSYECVCQDGYKLNPDGETCGDVDECEIQGVCEQDCVNTPGSYHCKCKPGFQLFGETHCGDIDECSIDNGGCQQSCVNTPGSFYCACESGYRLHYNKKDCIDSTVCFALKPAPKTELSCLRNGAVHNCTFRCRENASLTSGLPETLFCGLHTKYSWQYGERPTKQSNDILLSCSNDIHPPSYMTQAKVLMAGFKCNQSALNATIAAANQFIQRFTANIRCVKPECNITTVHATCEYSQKVLSKASLKKGEATRLTTNIVMAPKINLKSPESPNSGRDATDKALKVMIGWYRKYINSGKFNARMNDSELKMVPKTLRLQKNFLQVCPKSLVKVNNVCVGCGVGSYYSEQEEECLPCPPGTYQLLEGQDKCIPCEADYKSNPHPACIGICQPGTYSSDGLLPCHQCPQGTYQPDIGRTACKSCGSNATSIFTGSSKFEHCTIKEPCDFGHHHNIFTGKCEMCPAGYYQDQKGQPFCKKCPGNSTTDFTGSTDVGQCKNMDCVSFMGELQGYVQSPNYPGDYPTNVECVWNVKPGPGRRLLVIVPGLDLADDKCGDRLVMRKLKSPYSAITFDSCKSLRGPLAISSRTKNLWIQFQSDANLTAKGFRIPFVTYNEQYQALIEDIVQDSRLYSSHNHLEILKDRKLLDALMEVIAQPYNYYKYANEQNKMFPASFIRLMTPKVRRFFSQR